MVSTHAAYPPAGAADQQAKLTQALTDWHKPPPDLTPFTTLRLFRQAYTGDVTQTLNLLLARALVHLALTHPEHAQVLHSRLVLNEKSEAAFVRLHLSEATFYRKRTEGLPLLSAALWALEAEARQRHWDIMTQRLEAATYSRLIGEPSALSTLRHTLLTPNAPWLLTITGIGGIGKTTLADVLVRRLLADAQWHGIGWVTARPHFFNAGGSITAQPDPKLTAYRMIDALAGQLLGEGRANSQQSHTETMAALERLLKAEAHLIVIDNLESVTDLQTLLPLLRRLANPTKFLITSRVALYDEADLYHEVAPELDEATALALVRYEADLRNIPAVRSATDEELRPLYAAVGGNPLALKLLTSQLRIHPLAVVLNDLMGARSRSVEALYTYIYQQAWALLDASAQDLLLAMPLVSEQGGKLALLETITELSTAELRAALDTLVTMNLVDVRGDLHERRYTIHSLTRAFLHEQVLRWR